MRDLCLLSSCQCFSGRSIQHMEQHDVRTRLKEFLPASHYRLALGRHVSNPQNDVKSGTSIPCSEQSFRAACLQNETAPKSFNFKTKNGPKNDPKLPRKILSLVLLCRISHRHYSKIFHREFPHKIKYFFTTRICRHGHANKAPSILAMSNSGGTSVNLSESGAATRKRHTVIKCVA